MKVLFITNQARSTYYFWSVLMQSILAKGHEVVCCVPCEGNFQYIKELQAKGLRVIVYPLERKGLNPWQDVKTIYALYKILKIEKPNRLFTATIKPVIYGNIAAKLARVEQKFSCITGLGFCFEQSNSFWKRLLHYSVTLLYKISLSVVKLVFFQNEGDREVFLKKKIVNKNKTMLCNGTGVDTNYFAFSKSFPQTSTFLLVARLLEAKGIADFASAAKLLKQKYPEARFQLLGPKEEGLGALSFSKVFAWQSAGYIEYLGEANDVRPFIESASVVVLPSYGEGLSCALMEAMSMGRPIIASNVHGCKELISHGQNGYLVPVSDPMTLAKAMEQFILEPKTIEAMGLKSRQVVEAKFDAKKVAAEIIHNMEIN